MGGYIIIDLKNDAFTVGTEKEVNNAWAIFNASKPVMIYGLKIGSVAYKPFFAPELFVNSDGEVEGVIAGKKFTVNDDNEIKFATIE